jgi:hypothetical protein
LELVDEVRRWRRWAYLVTAIAFVSTSMAAVALVLQFDERRRTDTSAANVRALRGEIAELEGRVRSAQQRRRP